MRIIAGKLGGRQFDSPRGNRTHPMSDRVRGALFNTLGDITGLTVLDAFAGSGALSFEAVSRGATHSIAIDRDKNAIRALRENVRQLDVGDSVKPIQANSSGWSDLNPDKLFDIVILAPPYDSLQEAVLEKLARHTKPGGILIIDWPGKVSGPRFNGFELVTHKDYGDAALFFFRPT